MEKKNEFVHHLLGSIEYNAKVASKAPVESSAL